VFCPAGGTIDNVYLHKYWARVLRRSSVANYCFNTVVIQKSPELINSLLYYSIKEASRQSNDIDDISDEMTIERIKRKMLGDIYLDSLFLLTLEPEHVPLALKGDMFKKTFGTSRDVTLDTVELCYEDESCIRISFETAWSPPINWAMHVSGKYNTLVNVTYEEPNQGFGGVFECEKGVIIVAEYE
jgi:hypothetical protein